MEENIELLSGLWGVQNDTVGETPLKEPMADFSLSSSFDEGFFGSIDSVRLDFVEPETSPPDGFS